MLVSRVGYIFFVFLLSSVPRGKRHWKPYYAYLKGFVLYFAPVSVTNLQHTYARVTVVVLCVTTLAHSTSNYSCNQRYSQVPHLHFDSWLFWGKSWHGKANMRIELTSSRFCARFGRTKCRNNTSSVECCCRR